MGIDSILIDEARTPLIISGGSKNNSSYQAADRFVKSLNDEDYEIDVESKINWSLHFRYG